MATTQSDKKERRRQERLERERTARAAERRRRLWSYAGAAALLVVLAALGAVILATDSGGGEEPSAADAPPVAGAPSSGAESGGHVHGLGVALAGDGVLIATHDGLYSAAGDGSAPVQVSAEQQDFMGFTVAAPDRLLASGHPAAGQDLPAALGLIESRDGGRTWQPVSLLGEADFHVLRAAGERVYGFDGAGGRFLASADGGGTWQERELPAPMFDLAIAPDDPQRLIAATEEGLFASNDAGGSWRPADDATGLVAWAPSGRLFVVDEQAQVLSGAPDGPLSRRGALPELPVTFMAAQGALYAALADGSVLRSVDEGASWTAIAQV
ncbi:MAG: hypothetical protein MSC31_11335 [Solirubrobacteraceae bacterium MAG38_C4-C5]|nr:hypothetical protein [Candidatus Siliceabacter maunaloa]